MIELFLYNFLGQPQDQMPETRSNFVGNAVMLFASADAITASLATLTHNAMNGRPTYEITPGGYFYYPPGHDTQAPFNGFEAGIWTYHPKEPGGPKLSRPAMDSIRAMLDIARAHDLELIFLATPNHAYVDYYLDAIGAWGLVEEWLVELSAQATVYSFSQPNAWVYEPVGNRMIYWNDPFHFSLTMGRGMLASLAGLPMSGLPDNFMERVAPERVASLIDRRRQAVRLWAQANPAFVARFEDERRKWLAAQPPGTPK